MRVAHVVFSLSVGGQERLIVRLSHALREQGHDVRVIRLTQGGELRRDLAPIEIVDVTRQGGFEPSLYPRLARAFRAMKPDVVHTHNPGPLLYAVPAAKLAGVKHIVHTKHGANAVYSRQSLAFARAASKMVSAFVAVSDDTAVVARGLERPPASKLHVIANGVPLGDFGRDAKERSRVRAELAIADDACVIGTVGRIVVEKDYPLLVRAMAPLLSEKTRLVIVGDGNDRGEVEAAIARDVPEASRRFVTLTGMRRDVPAMLASFDVFAMSSKSEGLPLVVPEAMASRLPVVATAVGGLPGIVPPHVGTLVPHGDARALGEAIATFVRDPAKRAKAGDAAYAYAHERFSLDRMTREYERLYAGLIRLVCYAFAFVASCSSSDSPTPSPSLMVRRRTRSPRFATSAIRRPTRRSRRATPPGSRWSSATRRASRVTESDETGQIKDEGAIPPRLDSLLRPVGPAGALPASEETSRPIAGGTDWRGQFAIVEGYNSNVVQSQANRISPFVPHPSPFTGADASVTLLTWANATDEHLVRLQVRGQHYEPLENYTQPDDGSVNGGWAGQFTLSERSTIVGRVLGTLTTVNSSRLSDGPLFQIDPSGLQRTYTLGTARFSFVHELTPRWRIVSGLDVEASSTVNDTPFSLPDGRLVHHQGLDYVQPGYDVAVFHDLDEKNIISAKLRYDPLYIAFLVNYARNPPSFDGHAFVGMGEGEVGWVHAFSERFRAWTTVGGILSSPPPLDSDRRLITSPLVMEELTYQKEYWVTTLGLTYAYGSASPRLGFGPSAGAALTIEGRPFPNTEHLRELALLINGIANRAVFREGATELSRLTFASAGVEARYAVNNWLGILGGYNMRYATFEGFSTFPTLVRHVVFFGLSGYFATDRTLPTLDSFVSPVTPPG